jgi:DNA-binding SARP family transcriptional activator
MNFGILGPLEVRGDRGELPIGGGKQRALLALLLIHPNESLSTDTLIDALWADEPPPTAAKILQNYVSQLRRVLGDDRLLTQARGYALRVAPGELDLDRFKQRLEEGRRAQAAGDHERASLLLSEALSLWRGSPLADFAYEAFASSEITRLEELHLSAQSEWVEAELGLGRHAAVIAELEALVAQQPLQERLRGQLMLALYRSGRQAEALELYRDARRLLVDELGIAPSQALQRLEQSILTHDPALEPPPSEQPFPVVGALRAVVRDRRALTAVLAAATVVGAAAAALYVWTDRQGTTPIVSGNAVAIIDPHSDRVTGQVEVGAVPAALTLGRGSLWVANTVDQTVSRIDLASGNVVRAIAVGGIPLSIAAGKNAVWVVRRRADGYPELIAIDPRFDVVEQAPRRIPGDPLSEASVVAGLDGLWVAAEAGSLQHLDPAGAGSRRASTRATTSPASPSAPAVSGPATRAATASPASIRLASSWSRRLRSDRGRAQSPSAPGRSGWPTASTTRSFASTLRRTPSQRRFRSAARRRTSPRASAASGWQTAGTGRCPGSIPAATGL